MSITKLKVNEKGDATILVAKKGGLVTLYVEEVELLKEVPESLAFDAILVSGPKKGHMRANPQAWCWDTDRDFGIHFGYLALVSDYMAWRSDLRWTSRPPLPPAIRPRITQEELITEPSPCEWWSKAQFHWEDCDERGDVEGDEYETFGPFGSEAEAIAAGGEDHSELTVWCVAK